MKRLGWILLAPVILLPDTLILRDGTRHSGTFVSGTSRNLTFQLENGTRRSFAMTNVDELAFNRTTEPAANVSPAGTQRIDAVQRLHDDIEVAMDNATLSSRQQRMLEDARGSLATAIRDYRDGTQIDSREVRSAIDNVRSVANANVLRTQDRRMLMDDIEAIRQTNTGTRSRTR